MDPIKCTYIEAKLDLKSCGEFSILAPVIWAHCSVWVNGKKIIYS